MDAVTRDAARICVAMTTARRGNDRDWLGLLDAMLDDLGVVDPEERRTVTKAVAGIAVETSVYLYDLLGRGGADVDALLRGIGGALARMDDNEEHQQ